MSSNLEENLKFSLSKFNTGKLEQNWWEGPAWLRDPNSWPDQPMIENSEESETERKRVKEILAVTVLSETIYDELLVKYPIFKNLKNFKLDKTFPYQLQETTCAWPINIR